MWVGSLSPRKLFISDLGTERASPLPHAHSCPLPSVPTGKDGTLFFLLCGWTVCFSPGNSFSTLHPLCFLPGLGTERPGAVWLSLCPVSGPPVQARIHKHFPTPTRAPEAGTPHKYLEAPTAFQRVGGGGI